MKMTVLWLPCAPECLMRPSWLRGFVQLRHVFLMWLTLPFLCYLLPYFSNILLLLFNVFMWKDLEDWLSMSLSHYFRILRQSLDFAVTPGNQPLSMYLLLALHVILRTRTFSSRTSSLAGCVSGRGLSALIWAWLSAHRPSSSSPLPACLVLLPLCPLACVSVLAHALLSWVGSCGLCDIAKLGSLYQFPSSLFIVTPLVTYIGGPPKLRVWTSKMSMWRRRSGSCGIHL